MFQGSENVEKGEHFSLVQAAGGTLNAQHVAGPDELLRDPPRPRARAGAVARGRPHGEPAAGDDPGEARQPARRREERAPLDASTTSRTATGTSGSRRSSTPRGTPTITRRSARWRTSTPPRSTTSAILRDLLRPEQRGAHDRRGLRDRCGPRHDRAPLRTDPGECHTAAAARTTSTRSSAARSRVTVPDQVPLPRVYLAHRIRPFGTDAFDALDVAADVLGSGRASRLYASLVREQQLAQDASVFVSRSSAGASMFTLWVTARPGVAPDDARGRDPGGDRSPRDRGPD